MKNPTIDLFSEKIGYYFETKEELLELVSAYRGCRLNVDVDKYWHRDWCTSIKFVLNQLLPGEVFDPDKAYSKFDQIISLYISSLGEKDD